VLRRATVRMPLRQRAQADLVAVSDRRCRQEGLDAHVLQSATHGNSTARICLRWVRPNPANIAPSHHFLIERARAEEIPGTGCA
jgi:hypothetical protein